MNKKTLPLFITLVLSVAACNYFSSDTDLSDKAKSAFLENKLNEANLLAKQALKKNKDNAQARFIMAQIADLQGRIGDAEIDYRRAYEAGHDIKKTLPAFIDILVLQKNHNDIPELLKNLPEDMQAQKLYWTGLFYLGDNYLDQADDFFDKSIKHSKQTFPNAFIGKALVAISKNKIDIALNYVDKALEIDAEYLDAQLMKAELLVKRGKDTLAKPILLSILKRNSNTVPSKKYFFAKSTLIQIYWRSKEIQLTEKHVGELLRRYRNNPIAMYYGAMVNFERGRYVTANNFLQQVLRISPKHTASLGLMGSVKYKQGFYEQADFYLSSALVNKPNDPDLSKMLAATRLKQNQTSSAISLLDETSTKESDPLILWLSGKAEIQAGNTNQGLTLLKRAAQLSPESENMHLDIAQTYLSMGEIDEAIAELNNLSSTESINEQKELFFIYDHIQKGNFNDALRALKILINKKPDDLSLYIALGNTYAAMRQSTKAIEAYQMAATGDTLIKANLLLARIYTQNNDLIAAEQAFKAIIAVEEDHFQALSGLVTLAMLEKNDKKYQTTITQLQTIHPQNPDSFLIQARQEMGTKDFANAEHTLQKVIQLDEKHVTAILMLTTTLVQNGKINPAIFFLQDKLRLPELKKASHLHYQLAMLHDKNQDTPKALKSVKTALKLRPDNGDYLLSYTKLLKQTGQNEQALSVLESFVEANPQSSSGYTLLGDFLFSQGFFELAADNYTQAQRITPSEAHTIKLFRAQVRLNKPNADTILAEWLQENPEDDAAKAEWGGYKLSKNDFTGAIKQYEAIKAKNAPILNNLAWAYLQVKNKLAIDIARQAYELAPNSPEIADTYGWILVNMGKLADGLRVLNKAYAGKPESVDIQYHLAYALVKSGQYETAQNLLDGILNNTSAIGFHSRARKLLIEIP